VGPELPNLAKHRTILLQTFNIAQLVDSGLHCRILPLYSATPIIPPLKFVMWTIETLISISQNQHEPALFDLVCQQAAPSCSFLTPFGFFLIFSRLQVHIQNFIMSICTTQFMNEFWVKTIALDRSEG